MATCFDQEMFGLATLLYVDVKTFGGNWCEMTSERQKWRQNRPTEVMQGRVVLQPLM